MREWLRCSGGSAGWGRGRKGENAAALRPLCIRASRNSAPRGLLHKVSKVRMREGDYRESDEALMEVAERQFGSGITKTQQAASPQDWEPWEVPVEVRVPPLPHQRVCCSERRGRGREGG